LQFIQLIFLGFSSGPGNLDRWHLLAWIGYS